ncbi:MAG: SPFH domain-containing protein [Gammaproteobacteria bacterium]|uniref:SPFH and helix-turn-helix domain-containing protein n=1 Tax=Rhodoferax sp. TaxID=50421 RepID=UPI0017EB16FB|nr:SPFH and helix-turn-helix domain-containing protein [Rhodoferax sp.]MBU3899957.1 SPFH domain-containing protein [Gammaproteobacteria bacterium]MBA3056337.1 helix-turn-helix domain-containing protein [Rhodoferax sp.]MBU3995979.1 SPFH domain-containing protein [Gammaproteobacteria bacterium]MBU4019223.1 SPFH domain-containing protein [Gammaproteobacteria bacterium]MBU4078941.1 SPFH domain-containing protein [Gammaproteobacteria bacterium]
MSLLNIIKNQLIEVIEWNDDSRDTLSYRWPDDDKEIKNGAQLIVRESQLVQFVAAGRYADLFQPGKHTLSTENVPVLSTILGWKYGFQSPFKCDIYYLNTRLFTGNKWGTANPIMMRDRDFGVVRLRAFGTYDFRIVEPARFLREVAGTDQNFRLDEFADTMRSRLVSVFTEALARASVPALDVAQRYGELGDALLPIINPAMREKYGLEITTFILENVSVPPEVEQAIDKRSSMSVIGNLNDYVKYQMGVAMGQGGEAGAAATLPAQMAMGFGMAQEMVRNMQAGATAPSTAAAGVASSALPAANTLEVLTPEQAAQVLGVSLEDVMASIHAGDLKARKMGSAWRIAKSALEEFLRG